jgi:hypothetical protein
MTTATTKEARYSKESVRSGFDRTYVEEAEKEFGMDSDALDAAAALCQFDTSAAYNAGDGALDVPAAIGVVLLTHLSALTNAVLAVAAELRVLNDRAEGRRDAPRLHKRAAGQGRCGADPGGAGGSEVRQRRALGTASSLALFRPNHGVLAWCPAQRRF